MIPDMQITSKTPNMAIKNLKIPIPLSTGIVIEVIIAS
jgi:hypothetical protein